MHLKNNGFLAQYVSFGLKINSCIELPLQPAVFDEADVVIHNGEHKLSLENYLDQGVWRIHEKGARYKEVQISDRETVFFGLEFGDALVRNGDELLLVFNEVSSREEWLQLFILSAMIPELLKQRGVFALHASGVKLEHKLVAFAGESGMGKSTTVASLLVKGGEMVADDIMLIDFDAEGNVRAFPEYSQIRLSKESAEAIEPDWLQRGERNAWAADKWLIPTPLLNDSHDALNTIYFLDWGDDFHISNLTKTEAFEKMHKLTYRMRYTSKQLRILHFKWLNKATEKIHMKLLIRPRQLNRLDGLVTIIKQDLNKPIKA